MKKVLLTGGLGFIGRHVLAKLREQQMLTYLVVRPNKAMPDYAVSDEVIPVYADLADRKALQQQVEQLQFDTILHIGAVRGGTPVGRNIYKKVNVEATEVLAGIALNKSAKFVFCSSVGVFGAIPEDLPPTEASERKRDNYYHTTKILAEEGLQALTHQGLELVIIRPSITYGIGDFGFPYSLIHLVNTGRFLNCTVPIDIAMGDVRTLADAFFNAATYELKSGSAYNICDKAPVALRDLVDFISQNLFQKPYPRLKTLPAIAFRIGEYLAGNILHNELWKARFQLISRSWYYNPELAAHDLHITPKETLPNFKYVIDWYTSYMKKER
jgi:nucleoside-diphosphate-sugar epimerase